MKNLILAILFGLLFPTLMCIAFFMKEEETPTLAAATETTASATQTTETQPVRPVTLWIPVETESGITDMQLEEYVLGVLLREMPTYFEAEAMKAQAVAARTYTLRRFLLGYKHDGGAVCTDPSCCQAYVSEEDYLTSGGSSERLSYVRQAVESTRGEYLTYGGEPIEATYFSCSGGMTESAVAVWGQEVAYLQATESPGEENATHFQETVYFTKASLGKKLGVSLSGSSDRWVGNVQYTDGGGVESVSIGGVTFTGTELRSRLGLRSTALEFRADDSGMHITAKGFGHRVGMSQYGANAMALVGNDYRQILEHYYVGTQLTVYGG